MVFKPLLEAIVWEDKAYTQWMTGEGQGFKERQREMVPARIAVGIGKGVPGGAPPNPSRLGERGVGVGVGRGRLRQRSQDLHGGVS